MEGEEEEEEAGCGEEECGEEELGCGEEVGVGRRS